MSVEASSLTPGSPALPSSYQTSALELWIRRNTARPESVGELVSGLAALTLPTEPWQPGETVNPYRGNLESQCWFWNQAANAFVERGHWMAAAQVWSAHYLTYLSMQLKFRQRYHKGMPLCNIGYALERAGQKRLAIKCWLLGVVEDAITDLSSASEAVSYRNLRKNRVAPTVLNQLVGAVESRFTGQLIVPQFPETVIELWRHPEMVAASERCLTAVDALSEQLTHSYPALPEPSNPWAKTLAPAWEFADWVEGVWNGV